MFPFQFSDPVFTFPVLGNFQQCYLGQSPKIRKFQSKWQYHGEQQETKADFWPIKLIKKSARGDRKKLVRIIRAKLPLLLVHATIFLSDWPITIFSKLLMRNGFSGSYVSSHEVKWVKDKNCSHFFCVKKKIIFQRS